MKLIDKLKNVFFEEVEEDEDEEELPQTFARKVEVPKKKVELPKKEVEIKNFEKPDFSKNEVKEEEEVHIPFKEEEKKETEPEKEFPMMFDDDDFLEDKDVRYEKDDSLNSFQSETLYKKEIKEQNEERGLYQGKREISYVESVNNKPTYSYTKSYYEEKETKSFRPSPIISPIYGILDRDYSKDEVVTKRETRILSSSNKPDLDSIRNKAFGSEDDNIHKEKSKNEEVFPRDDNKKVYDVNSNKPQVNRVTLADADEYYNDLGLAYNVDYSDASRNTGTRVSKYNSKGKKKSNNNVDDNLFDLIDSMYNKEE